MNLVIAYGNPLRGDDGVGWAIAERVEAAVPDATVLVRHQLVPELAEAIAEATTVVFVDARCGSTPGCVRCEPLTPQRCRGPLGHVQTPAALLAMAADLFQREPVAYLVSVDVAACELGGELSPAAVTAVPEASGVVVRLLHP